MKPFLQQAGETLRQLGTDPAAGLGAAQVEESRRIHGAGAFTREKTKSIWRRLWDAASEPMLLMLVFAGVIAVGVNAARALTGGESDFLECVGIFAAIALSVVITVVMEGKSAKAFETLSRMTEDNQVKAIRGGEVCLIPQKDVVVGDILCVETGDKLPADGRLLESVDLLADESALTGESMAVRKDAGFVAADEKIPVAERACMLYSGCFIVGGCGKLVVTAVGDKTEFGKIARELSAPENATTPLQEKMAKLGKQIAALGISAAALVFLIQLGMFLYQGTASLDTISEAFITSIVLIVAAVPEGLPTIVAVSLAIGIIKMSRQNALVKKMVACETVGCINVVCSDKTGTLTENKMTVTGVCGVDGVLRGPEELQAPALLQNFCVNGTADVNFAGNAEFIGNPTECALLVAADKAGWDYRARRAAAEPVHTYPFSSETKNMTTIVREEGKAVVYTKGSPEKILAMCTNLDPRQQAAVEAQIVQCQEKACRVIGFAHKQLRDADPTDRAAVESGMHFDGFAAITDPLRADVLEAVERCRSAGIGLKILTGDNIVTARAIAEQLGLLEDGGAAVEAKELEHLSDRQLADRLPEIRVIARSTPTVKMRVVAALKASGNVVAVTGDGINDAPALKNADVGIAMGISGTEVSKEASDIVLLDDSFSTIARAVQWGRGIYENFQRFIQFQLTVNLSSVVVVLASILTGFAAPFTALQLLWINIIMDGPPALTLGLEPIRGNLMERRPTKRDAGIVSGGMLTRIVINGLFISAVFMGQHWCNFLGATAAQGPTVLFALFVVFQLFNAFNCRELGTTSVLRGVARNRLMLGVFALTFSLQVLIVQVGGAMFGTVPLPLAMWMKITALAATVIVASEAAKFILWCVRRVTGRQAGQARAAME